MLSASKPALSSMPVQSKGSVSVPSLASGGTTPGIDFTLAEGGFLSGLLADTSGTPLVEIDIDVFDANTNRVEVNATSQGNGQFRIGALPTGSYFLRADPNATQFVARTYYLAAADVSSALAVTVAVGQTNGALHMVLESAGAIAGVVASTNECDFYRAF